MPRRPGRALFALFFLFLPLLSLGCELALDFDRSLVNPEPEAGPPVIQSDGAPDGARG